MYNGILNVCKEKGYTSHDVVAKLRGILKQKKIGHTGTLDPDATGVLPVCLGSGTKLCDMITDKTKAYRAVLLFGQATDTQDSSGTVIKSYPDPEKMQQMVNEEAVRKVLQEFIGEYDQLPPMYSAIKINGKKLYELAREGKVVERKTRKVSFYKIDLVAYEYPRITIQVECSKGTYIRTLCHDIGEKMGVYGCMEELVRIKSGPFLLENSYTLAQIEDMTKDGSIDKAILPVDRMFEEFPAVSTKPEYDRILQNGNPLKPDMISGEYRDMSYIRVYDSTGCFKEVYTCEKNRTYLKPYKMFI